MFKKGFNILILSLFSLIVGINSVSAETAKLDYENRHTVNVPSLGNTVATKKLDGKTAYCIDHYKGAPNDGTKFTWDGSPTGENVLIGGQAYKIAKDKYSDGEYARIVGVLNGVYHESYRKDYIKDIYNTAKSRVSYYKTSKKLPSFKVTPDGNNVLQTTDGLKFVKKFTVSGLIDYKYGGVKGSSKSASELKYVDSSVPKYKITGSADVDEAHKGGNTAYICSDESCSTKFTEISANGTYYLVIVLASANPEYLTGTIQIDGSNYSKYPYIKRWEASSKVQRLATYGGTVKIEHTASAKFDFTYSMKPSASITKVNTNGEDLKGSSLVMFTSAVDLTKSTDTFEKLSSVVGNDIKKLCSFDVGDEVSCNNPNLDVTSDGYNADRYICYTEEKVPSEYVARTTGCTKIKTQGDSTEYIEETVGNTDVKTEFTFSGNHVSIYVQNGLNRLLISKKTINGDDELPGAKLGIYNVDANGNCTSDVVTAKEFENKEYTPIEDSSSDDGDSDITTGDSETNAGDTGDTEADAGDDDSETTLAEVNKLEWTSSSVPVVISGIKSGTYCLRENSAPHGYTVSSDTIFSIDKFNKVTLLSKNDTVLDSESNSELKNVIVVNDRIPTVTVSKQDMATSKELPGATISICETLEDNKTLKTTNGEEDDPTDCSVVELANGDKATWVSGTEPHIISGLPSGTYYLVEMTAPKGYTTAESILFTLKDDGTLVDAEGRSLADSKIVMHDKSIEDVKTGQLQMIIVCIIGLIAAGAGLFVYNKKANIGSGVVTKLSGKIRKRKIHK